MHPTGEIKLRDIRVDSDSVGQVQIPGVYLFRMANGVLQMATGSPMTLELINATIAHGVVALTITLAMSLGLIVPKMAIDWCREIGVRQTAALEMRPWLARAATMIQSRKGALHRNTLALPIALALVLLGIGFAANLDGKA
jgi:hypothetical protein